MHTEVLILCVGLKIKNIQLVVVLVLFFLFFSLPFLFCCKKCVCVCARARIYIVCSLLSHVFIAILLNTGQENNIGQPKPD